jgi:hypothetical protein
MNLQANEIFTKKFLALLTAAGTAVFIYTHRTPQTITPANVDANGTIHPYRPWLEQAQTGQNKTPSPIPRLAQPIPVSSPPVDTGCEIYPATAMINSHIKLFERKIASLQTGYLDTSATNPYQSCAKSATAQVTKAQLPKIEFGGIACPNDHQARLHTLESTKNLYYERYMALSHEPACASLLSALEPPSKDEAGGNGSVTTLPSANPTGANDREPSSTMVGVQ